MASEDLLTKFDEMVKRFKEEFSEIIEGERSKMKAEIEAFNAEKQRMNAHFEVSDEDIVTLNVGGQKLTTTRSTLCQIEGSLLASMFSGRWEDGLARDKDGCIFFDYNPQYFGIILDWLRARKVSTPENPAPSPNVPENQAKNFYNLVEYLGLSEEIIPSMPGEKFNMCSAGIDLLDDGKVAAHDENPSQHRYVLGDNVYQQGIVHVKYKLESFQANNWVLVGIVKGDDVPQNDYSYKWLGSYAWALGNGGGGVWKAGSSTFDRTLKNVTKQGDTLELILDCDTAKVSLHLPTGQQYHIDIPRGNTWRFLVGLYGANDKIHIMDVQKLH